MRAALYGLTLCALATTTAACGEDEPPPPAKTPAKTPVKTTTAKTGTSAAVPVIAYRRVEDRVTADEKKKIRHVFREEDFTPDLTGTENRDPFRSFVVAQPGIGAAGGPPTEATEQCPKTRQLARSFSARELDLVGIVTRGTIRYALFSDSNHYGYVIHVGDCVGKEKARIKEIGASFVTVEISQETPPNQPPRPAEKRTIPLHPKELPVGETGDQSDEDDSVPADLRRRSDELLRGDRSQPPATEPAPSPATPPTMQ